MEKFAVDLDRVLDEFELNEDLRSESAVGQDLGLNRFDGSNSHYGGGHNRESAHLQNNREPPFVYMKPAIVMQPHLNVENSLDLSEADFAPAESSTAVRPLISKPRLQAKANAKVLNVERKALESNANSASNHVSATECLVSVSPLLHLSNAINQDKGVSDSDIEAKKPEVQECQEVPCQRLLPSEHRTVAAPSKPRKVENGTGVVDGIKVLHCDETINKDYLVNFGRRWDPNAVANSNAHVSVDKMDDAKVVSVARVETDNLNDEIQDEGISMDENDLELNGHLESGPLSTDCQQNTSSYRNDVGEETFVTPDDNVLTKAPVPMTCVGFLEDIDVTDEDFEHYLEGQNVDNDENLMDCEDQSLTTKEAFYTPMIESPIGFTASEEYPVDIQRVASMNSNIPTGDDSANSATRELETDGSESKVITTRDVEVDDELLVTFDEKTVLTESSREQEVNVKEFFITTPNVESSVNDETTTRLRQETNIGQELESQPNEQHCQAVPEHLQTSDIHQTEALECNVRLVPKVGSRDVASPPAYQDAWAREFEENEANAGAAIVASALPSDIDEDFSDATQRLPRPTSLNLTGKIEVVPSASIPEEVAEGHRQFGGLMATAGSPDAGLGVSPGSSDDLETPAGGHSLKPLLSEEERSVGKIAPVWVPDAEAPNCMQCETKFTVIKRRHHCRACGKVLCAQCCGLKAKLHYMENKEARVCQCCLEIMQKVQLLEQEGAGGSGFTGSTQVWGTTLPPSNRPPNPNNPSEYCSVIPPLQQCLANANAPPPTVMVPVGVLKRGGDRPKGEPKQVMFSDGIRPGGDLTELDGPEPKLPYRRQGRPQKKVERPSGSVLQASDLCHLTTEQREYSIDDQLDMEQIMSVIKDEAAEPVVFVIVKNLRVLVKIVNLDCCIHKTCWCFITRGMGAVGQDEIIFLLELLPDEQTVPYDIFYHLIDIYNDAGKGITISGMGHSVFNKSFLGSREHGGFLFIHPTFQCLQKIPLPTSPFLFGILLQKWEIPWAKVFPLRLLLRLGAEFRYYPTPLVGVRFRKPVFCEIGHTIVNLLADFRNYQYSLPSVPGLVVHMEDKQTYINFPRNRYDEVVKALNSSIDHVLALASSFSTEADSHLVCIQNEDGNYQTQAISIKDKPRKITGSSFVVFNGALKSSSGLTAKSSIVEDGLMVQISGESMLALRQALRDMRNYAVPCGPIGAEQPDEVVHIQWVEDDRNVNVGVKSPIDGMSMDGVSSIRIHCGTDYVGDGHLIRWTEVYLVRTDEAVGSRRSDPVDVSKVSDNLAQACCVALAPHLGHLYAAGFSKIGLRVTLDSDNVGYEIGAGGEHLSSIYMNDLDSELVPAMHCAVSPTQEGSILLELIFHVIQQ